ncbi:MAG: transpeptidase family protein [Treponema sp.]|nr:transpeptidase family protein [Candidatus Treponema equifaecale]
MQMNGYIKKIPLYIFVGISVAFTLYVIVNYGIFAFTEPPLPPQEQTEIQRGSILDRNGKALAVPANYYHFGVTPATIQTKGIENFAQLVSPVLGINEGELKQQILNSIDSSFIYLKKKIDQTAYEKLKKICSKNGLSSAVRFDKVPGRVYPENNLASQLVGFMGADGKGLAGIEYSMQDTLFPPQNPDSDPVQGKNIYLTIDANLQSSLEKITIDVMEETRAESLMLIAAEAKTGEVISYISLPEANLNEYTKASSEQMRNRPATDGYEPGSVFKIFSVASFLDSGGISESDIFLCDGIYSKRVQSGELIKITCLEHHGWITAKGALEGSCNDALAQMSEHIESEPFLAKLRSLGFGSKPGTEMPGETPGLVRNTSDRFWSARSKPTIAIGQEITVSALQMVQAATAIANGGVPVQLTFVSKITDNTGREEYTHAPIYKDRVFRSSTTDYLLSCMQTVAKSGTGHRANIGDVSIGVKTGTAQMADPVNGGYSKTDFISNCIAIFPVEKPEIILYIVIQKARGETYAGRIVAPVIAKAADVIIDHLGMSRGSASSLAHSGSISISGTAPVTLETTVPDFKGMSKRQLLPVLDRKDIHVKINGDGWVTTQNPPAGTPITENMEIELYLE